jgi:hypothetical protein
MKRFLFAAVFLLGVLAFPNPGAAQVLETQCPAGSSVNSWGSARDGSNGKIRQNYCTDGNGNAILNFGTGGNPSTPAFSLQFDNSGLFGGVLGSAVNPTTGEISLTPAVDGARGLNVNPSSQNFGSVSPALSVNAGAGTITCETLGGFAPAEMCLNGATNQPWLYNLSILGDATNTASPSLAFFDTSRSTPNQATGLVGDSQCSTDFGASPAITGCLNLSYSGTDGSSANLFLLGDHSIQLGLGGGASPPVGSQPFFTWGIQGDIPGGYIEADNGEIQAGWIPTAAAVNARTGFVSIVDAPAAHKVLLKNPGTLSANYEFDYPITPGTAGQVLESQGGAGTPMIWQKYNQIPVGTLAAAGTCNSGAEGTERGVTDSNTVVWGATVAGSSTNHVLAYCDGTNWTVAGK